MEAMFLKLLNMSITASYLVILILVLRAIFPRIPRVVYCCLWAMVGLRLVLPFSFESVLSLIPSTQPVPPEILYQQMPVVTTGTAVIDQAIHPGAVSSFIPAPGDSVNPIRVITAVCTWAWVLGMAVMLLHTLISYAKIRRQVVEAVPEQGCFSCDHIDTPFILGVFQPRIYLPSDMDDQDRFYVLAHEQAHLSRRDNLWKPLGYLLLTVYWFNPLLWLAYVFFCRDIELACDEKVVRALGTAGKKAYSQALIHCSTRKQLISACPLAFGEVGVKKRIETILHYRKPGLWILLIAVVLCVVTAVCFLTDPKEKAEFELQDLDLQNYTGFILKNPKTGYMASHSFQKGDSYLPLLNRIQGENPRPADLSQQYSYVLAFPDTGKGPLTLSFCEDGCFSINGESGDILYDGKGTAAQELLETLRKQEGPASQTSKIGPDPDWGIALLAEDITPTHAVIRFIDSEETPEQTYYQEPGYSLEMKTSNGWVRLNVERENSSGERTEIDLPWYRRGGNGYYLEWKDVPPLSTGQYRIGLAVTAGEETRWLYGEFSVSSGLNKNGMVPLAELPAHYTQEEADLDGCLILSEGRVTHGMDRWEAFLDQFNQGNPAYLRLCKAPTYGDTVPVEEVYDIESGEDGFWVSWLSDGRLLTKRYSNLWHDMGQDPEAGYYDQWEKWFLTDESGTFQYVQESGVPYLVICEIRYHTPEGLPFPENTAKVRLEFEGKTYAQTEDPAAIAGLRKLFERAEYCYGGVKTHNIDGQLNLIAEDAVGNFIRIELDPLWDICRVGEDYYGYGAPDELPYIDRIWKQLGMEQWPQPVYDRIPEAYRDPYAPGAVWEPDCEEYINLREEPGSHEILLRIPLGETFTMIRREELYALVEYQGMEGWVHTGYIKPVN